MLPVAPSPAGSLGRSCGARQYVSSTAGNPIAPAAAARAGFRSPATGPGAEASTCAVPGSLWKRAQRPVVRAAPLDAVSRTDCSEVAGTRGLWPARSLDSPRIALNGQRRRSRCRKRPVFHDRQPDTQPGAHLPAALPGWLVPVTSWRHPTRSNPATCGTSGAWGNRSPCSRVSCLGDEARLEIGGRVDEWTRSRASIAFLGPGSIVRFAFQIPRIGAIIMFQSHPPAEVLQQRARRRWFAARRGPRIRVSHGIGNWISHGRRDGAIWKSKICRPCPPGTGETDLKRKMHQGYRHALTVPSLTCG